MYIDQGFGGVKTVDNGRPKVLKFPKIPAKLCLNGRLWTQYFDGIIFQDFTEFREKKSTTISRGDLLANIGPRNSQQKADCGFKHAAQFRVLS